MHSELISYEPATGAVLWRGAVSDVSAEVEAARGAWAEWASRPLALRTETLRRYVNIVRGKQDKLADLIARETGKPLWEARTEVETALGPVEVVVANAGITRDTLLLRMSEDDFTSVVDTNLTGAFRVVKRASKGMLKARFGRVVLISSVVGLYGSAGQVNYSASKAGLVGMARSLTRELGARNITANVVAPGFIETDMTDELPEAQQAEYKKSIPLGRFASPGEVARVVTWLAGDDAGYISGAVIPVDGGLGMGH
jgi:3-oxoacyl-[acyl-carrier protein] reductase